MSFEKLPSGYDFWRTAAPWEEAFDHSLDCPLHEDNHDGEAAVCECPKKEEIKALRAEARADAKE